MKKIILFTGWFCLQGTASLTFAQDIDYKGLPEWSKKVQGTTEYYLYTPKNLKPGEKYPIALFMHGCCGEDNIARLRNCVDPPVRMWHNFGENTQTVPTYIIAPATTSGWSQHFPNLKAVIDDLVANHQGDPQRIYVCGFSMGGGGTYDFMNTYPGYVAAAIPMGMTFSGDIQKAKNIPFWANRGSLDSYCATLPDYVKQIRAANGDTRDTAYVWETGVNPLFSDFIGVGHGVQWDAASTQDLTGWAYSKINDGNYYPNVYFKSPRYKEVFTRSRIPFEVIASDNDGTISKVEIYVNGLLTSTLTTSPYKDSVTIHPGDNVLEARAYDNKGKYSTSKIIVRINNLPVLLNTYLPDARKGAYYLEKLYAEGNGPFTYKISSKGNALPAGLTLESDGTLKGIPQVTGTFTIAVVVVDEDKDSSMRVLPLAVREMNANEVLVTDYRTYPWYPVILSKLRKGDVPNAEAGNEINFSNLSVYGGLTALYPSIRGANSTATEYLSFKVSDDVIVRVAYEKMDCTLTTTVPSWLNDFTKETGKEIVAQYRYFDVYRKNYSKGTITLPGPNAAVNGVYYSYFVMVQKAGVDPNTSPEITNKKVMRAYLGHEFKDYLAVLDGEGNMTWELSSGTLPPGITLSRDGLLKGFPQAKGSYTFFLKVKDCNGDSLSSSFTITVDDMIYPVYASVKDTAVMVNTGTVTLSLSGITNGVSPVQNITVQLIPDRTDVITLTNPVNTGGDNYSFTFTPLPDKAGITLVNVKITDHNNPDSTFGVTDNYFRIKVLTDKNHPPTCDSIPDISVAKSSLKQSIIFTGVTDGDGNVEPQTITASVTATNLYTVIINPTVSYTSGSSTGTINFYTGAIGTSVFTLTLKDNGGIDLGGADTKIVTFKVTVRGAAEEEEKEGVDVYPNPFSNRLTIHIRQGNYQTLSLINAAGQTLMMKGIFDATAELDMESLPPGVYQLVLEGKGERFSKQVVKVK